LRKALVLAITALVLACTPSDARAHPIGFAVLAIEEGAPRTYDVVLRVSGSETDPGNLAVRWPEGCTERDVLSTTVDEVRERRSTITCETALTGRTLHVDGPARGIELLVDAHFANGRHERFASRTLPVDAVLGDADGRSLAIAHLVLGLEHFAFGIDHVLFVVGAFFLARRLGTRALVLVITAFTIGHALTLALATLSVLVLAPRPVEACIALSLVHVARELRLSRDTITRTRPALVCALFGLVHGAGFARALGDAGLGGADLAVGLVAFNVGLELAQLGLVLACVGLFRGPLAKRTEPIAALVIGGVGAYLVLDRTLGWIVTHTS
jgi:hypothetical protein